MLSLKDKPKDSKILAFTDNSSALGWLHKDSFHPASKVAHNKVARKFALFMMKKESSLYSEHFKGESNSVAGILSREFLSNKSNLTNYLYCMFPKQMPKNFKIIDLPNEIVCWISSILEEKIVKKEQHDNLLINQRHTLENGKIFAPKQVSKIDSWVR